MKIALVAAEMSPYAKAGGLADVLGALPAELQALGMRPCVILPGYRALLAALPSEAVGGRFTLRLGGELEHFTLRSAIGPAGVPLFLIVHERYFDRPGIYAEGGRDYPDNLRRYIFFGRAAAAVMATHIRPELVHAHDWHAAMALIAMRCDPALQPALGATAAVFTIHNLAFQGLLAAADFTLLGIPPSYMGLSHLEFHGAANLMKGAIVLADLASTVSPTYAREVVSDPAMGFGLEGVLRDKGERFVGILNGADYAEWNPASDPHLARAYGPADWQAGKAACRADLRAILNLAPDSGHALVGMVSRITEQKGFDLLAGALERLLKLPLDFAILGSGEPTLEAPFTAASRAYPGRIQLRTEFDNALAHKIQAGSDLFLMPSRFEPCGLTQMYALKYATPPIVRRTGGLADTVTPYDPGRGLGVGFDFEAYTAAALLEAVGQASELFQRGTASPAWRQLVENGLAADFSWRKAAQAYVDLFERARQARA